MLEKKKKKKKKIMKIKRKDKLDNETDVFLFLSSDFFVVFFPCFFLFFCCCCCLCWCVFFDPPKYQRKMEYWRKKVVEPLTATLSQGLSTHAIALSFACGFVGGIFPVPVASTFVCFAFIFVFSLNTVICQVTNFLATPVQFGLIVPFVKFGEKILQCDPLPLSAEALQAEMEKSVFGTIEKFASGFGVAIVGWVVVSLFVVPLLYIIIYAGIQRTESAKKKARGAKNPYLDKPKTS